MDCGVHRGVHGASIPRSPVMNDPCSQAVSEWLHGSRWARLGSGGPFFSWHERARRGLVFERAAAAMAAA
jgi:hypothetical protein